ncbi:hypothetical protein [Lactobacillus sp. ESL0677]|uniref:hypothetical protein n=1 Tax=Lactobacillus sp. ESL0677 TaxID=2983208 RepID=UPI0023F73B27|nr:hypothetical protein [Lactobacillus sp. ESL0677]WEV37463.1 hypothetical protein OZX76_02600 [Lactobacillus sp. ESL0677]
MNQLYKNQRYTFIKINSGIKNLNELKSNILSKIYKQQFNAKEIEYDSNDEETYFLYKWENIDEESLTDAGMTCKFRYFSAIATCEFSTRKIRDDNKKLLPKKERLNLQKTEVIFAQKDSQVFCIIYSFDNYELDRVRKLIGFSNIEPLPAVYQIVPEMFTWLFYKYITNNNDLGYCITIQGITSFTGNILSSENKFAGNSYVTPDLIITKAFLANNYSITSVQLDIEVESSITSFYINQTSTDNELRVMALKGSVADVLLDSGNELHIMPIYILFNIIPKIFKKYTEEIDDFENNKKKSFLSVLGVEVVKQIMARNNLTIDDIK